MFGCHCGPCPGDIHNRFGVGSTGAVFLSWMDIEGVKTLDIPCFLGKSFNIQDGANTYLNKGKKYIVRRIIKHEGVGIWSWMLKEIPETLMLWAFDPLQHDLRTDMGTDGFIYLFRQNPWKRLCFPFIEQMGTDAMNDLWPWEPLKILDFFKLTTDTTDVILLKLKK